MYVCMYIYIYIYIMLGRAGRDRLLPLGLLLAHEAQRNLAAGGGTSTQIQIHNS